MSGKSRQRHTSRSKRKKTRPGVALVTAPPAAEATPAAPATARTEAATPKPVVTPATPATPRRAATSAAIRTPAKLTAYPYVTAELKRIGILAGIMVVMLVLLALFLP